MYVGHRKPTSIRRTPPASPDAAKLLYAPKKRAALQSDSTTTVHKELAAVSKEQSVTMYAASVRMVHGLMRSPQVLDRPLNEGKCIGEIRGGSRVEVYQLVGEWARVCCDGRRGYVRVSRDGDVYLRKVR